MKKIATYGILGLLVVGLVMAAGFGWSSDIKTAIENNDYNAWKEAKMAQITEENFQMEENRYQQMGQHHEDMEARHDEMEAAMEQGYDAWVEYTADNPCPFADEITQDNFDQFVEMHNLMESGDIEGAKAIADEIGIPLMGPGMHGGMGRGMHGFDSDDS